MQIDNLCSLTCPCGQPLQLCKVRGEWVVGHIEEMCSPLIHCKEINEVMLSLGRLFKHYGHFPTREEYFRDKDKPELNHPWKS